MMCNRPSIFASVRLHDAPHGIVAGEHAATLGVDVQALVSAPGGECIWIDYGANDDLAGALDVALESLGLFFPFVECVGQSISVRHDRENARIVLTSVPGHPDSCGDVKGASEVLVFQGISPSDGGLSASIEGCSSGESQGLSGGHPHCFQSALVPAMAADTTTASFAAIAADDHGLPSPAADRAGARSVKAEGQLVLRWPQAQVHAIGAPRLRHLMSLAPAPAGISLDQDVLRSPTMFVHGRASTVMRGTARRSIRSVRADPAGRAGLSVGDRWGAGDGIDQTIRFFQSALVPAMAAGTTTALELSDPSVAVVVNQSVSHGVSCRSLPSGEIEPSVMLASAPCESSSGDGLGNHQPGSMTWGGQVRTPAPSGRARDRAICAVARSFHRRAA
jgi:hypothetical protein